MLLTPPFAASLPSKPLTWHWPIVLTTMLAVVALPSLLYMGIYYVRKGHCGLMPVKKVEHNTPESDAAQSLLQ